MDPLTPAQQQLVARNIPLVEHIVKRLTLRFPTGSDRDDLVQAGTLGLIEAAVRYDPGKAVAFSTFAGRRIEGAVLDHLRRDDWAPRSVRAGKRRLEHAEAELVARNRGDRPQPDQLAAALGVDPLDVHRLRTRIAAAAIDSLDRPIASDEPGGTLADTVTDRSAGSVESHLDDRELRGYLRDALALLPERHRFVVVGHFLEGRSMTELGQLLGVTQSRASQLKEDALRLIRQAVRAQYREGPVEPAGTRREQAYTESLRQASDWRSRLEHRQPVAV